MSLQRIKLTLWEAVDEFLKDLAEGDVCKNPRFPYNEYYRKLMSTVCEGKEDALDLIRIKPYYPFILIAYYILFHKRNLDLAGKIHNKLREFHDKYPYTFTSDEECTFEMLKEVIHEFETIRQSPKEEYKGRLSIRLREIARKLDRDYGEERCSGWSGLFKLLLQAHLDPMNIDEYDDEFQKMEESLQGLKSIYKEIEDMERKDDADYPDKDVNYYILLPLEEVEPLSPIYVFIKGLFEKHRKIINEKRQERYVLMAKRDVLESMRTISSHALEILKLKDVKKYLSLLPSPLWIIPSLLSFMGSWIIPKISIYWRLAIFVALLISSFYFEFYLAIEYYNKRINEFVDEVLLKDIYDIIWPSSRRLII